MEKYLEPLESGCSLQVFNEDKEVLRSSAKWLFPLFELEEFLNKHPEINRETLSLHDTVSGSAAAALVCRLKIKKVHSNLASEKALKVFEKFSVNEKYDLLVEKIKCVTEDLITEDMGLEEVYQMIFMRAKNGKNKI